MLFKRIKEIAKRKKGMSIKELGLTLNLGENAIYTWKKSNPSIEKVEKVSDFLEVSTDYLLGRCALNSITNEIDLKDQDLTLTYNGEPLSETDKKLLLSVTKALIAEHDHEFGDEQTHTSESHQE
ncbi:helix-turn-helix domain-containing protein [Enterococcus faecalis]